MAKGKNSCKNPLGEASNYTLKELVEVALKFNLQPYQIGIIIANAVRGEETYKPGKHGSEERYYHELAERLRDKLFSVIKKIRKKGLESVMGREIKELRNATESKFIGQYNNILNWSYLIYREIYRQDISLKIGGELNTEAKQFFEELVKLGLQSSEEEKSSEEGKNEYKSPLAAEYDVWGKKIVNWGNKKWREKY